MAKARFYGKPWLVFELHGLVWEARIVPQKHKVLRNGADAACVMFDSRVMYFGDHLSDEQLSTGLAHEVQHAIEEHADIDYEVATTLDVADRMTDQVGRSWLAIIRKGGPLMEVFQRARPL